MPDLQFVILHEREAYHYQLFTLVWRSIWKSERFLLDGCHICWLTSKRGNGLKWPKSCFKCIQNMTKSSLPMSSQVMKPGSIILSPSERLAIRSGPLNSKRPIIAKRSLSTKVLYAIFFSGEGVAIKMPVKKGKSITGEYYKDVVLKKLKKVLSETTPCHWF